MAPVRVVADPEKYERIVVARIETPSINDTLSVEELGGQLSRIGDAYGDAGIVVDFEDVQILSSMALAKLVAFNENVKKKDGTLVLCGLNDHIKGLFDLLKAERLFEIRKNEKKAVKAIRKKPSWRKK